MHVEVATVGRKHLNTYHAIVTDRRHRRTQEAESSMRFLNFAIKRRFVNRMGKSAVIDDDSGLSATDLENASGFARIAPL